MAQRPRLQQSQSEFRRFLIDGDLRQTGKVLFDLDSYRKVS